METKLTTITPAMAAQWLENAAPNRKQRENMIARYARDMGTGNWQINGSTIVRDPAGKILDGQHRLKACIYAGVSFKTLVVDGVVPEAFHTIDSNIVRTNSDLFHLSGASYAGTHAAAVALLWRYNQVPNIITLSTTPSKEEALATSAKFPDLPHWVEAARGAKHIIPQAMLAFVTCLGSREFDADVADLFLDAVAEGTNLAKNSPVYLLRERCRSSGSRSAKMPRMTVLALAIKAFNAFGHDERLSLLKWVKGEAFPLIGARTSQRIPNSKVRRLEQSRA